jgi:hypothetical protein
VSLSLGARHHFERVNYFGGGVAAACLRRMQSTLNMPAIDLIGCIMGRREGARVPRRWSFGVSPSPSLDSIKRKSGPPITWKNFSVSSKGRIQKACIQKASHFVLRIPRLPLTTHVRMQGQPARFSRESKLMLIDELGRDETRSVLPADLYD